MISINCLNLVSLFVFKNPIRESLLSLGEIAALFINACIGESFNLLTRKSNLLDKDYI